MARRPEIGNVQLYPDRPLRDSDKNGYVLKFYCPILGKRIRKNAGTRDRREARRIVRECRERLLDGKYIETGGAIASALEIQEAPVAPVHVSHGGAIDKSWEECFEHYYAYRKSRVRDKSLTDASSRLAIAKRILDGFREDRGVPEHTAIENLMTLESLEYVQDRLLAGDECRYDYRSPMTVNTTMGAIMAFVRHCHRHGWIAKIPHIVKLDVDDVMKGRPISVEEFDQMIKAVPEVVGLQQAASWERVLRILWESAFRVGDVMNFSWDDERKIHPVWPQNAEHPTIAIPSTQKNKKAQQIPMLPGLHDILAKTPGAQRRGWVVNPLPPTPNRTRTKADSFKPRSDDLARLARKYNHCAIALACGVSETAVRKWLCEVEKSSPYPGLPPGDIEASVISEIRKRAEGDQDDGVQSIDRLTKENVGRIISRIGEQANIIVQLADEETGKRIKYASAHDLRRSCAQRLINAGISAETLKIVMRHRDFSTTERFYGATRGAQAAANEIFAKLEQKGTETKQVEELTEAKLSKAELQKLRALLNSI